MTPTTHRAARTLFERVWRANQQALGLPDPSPRALQLWQAVAAHETSYASPAAWAKNTPAMAGSHNYGAIQCKGPESPTCIGGVRDNTQAGAPFVAFYRAYPTADEGALDLLRYLTRKLSRPELLAGTANSLAAAMYAEGYFTGICREALKADPQAAAESSSTRRAQGLGPAETSAGQACDREVVTFYGAKLKAYADEVAAAMGETQTPIGEAPGDLNLWPVFALLALAAAGAAGWYVWTRYYQDEPPPRQPMRRNAGRSEWRALYRSTCGEERDARRIEAADREDEETARSVSQAKLDRGEASKARKVATRASRKADALQARAAARKAELAATVAELRAAADAPCEDAKAALVKRTAQEEREASERRTPKQREASRRTLERLAEEIEREANEVESVITREHGADLGKLARRQFVRRGRYYLSKAKKAHRDTTPAELGIEAFEENLGNMGALLTSEEKSDAEFSAEEAAYYAEQAG